MFPAESVGVLTYGLNVSLVAWSFAETTDH